METSGWEELEKAILKDDGSTVKNLFNNQLKKYCNLPGKFNNRLSHFSNDLCNLSAVSSRSADCVNRYYHNRIRSHSSIGLTTRRLSYQTSIETACNFPGARKLSHSHPLQSSSSYLHSDATQPYGTTLTVFGHSGIRSLPDTRRGSVHHAEASNKNESPLPQVIRNAFHIAIQNSSFKALQSLLYAGLDPNAPGNYDPCSAVAGVIGGRDSIESPDCVHPLALLTIGACPSIIEDTDPVATTSNTSYTINENQYKEVLTNTTGNSRSNRTRRSSSIFAHLLTSDLNQISSLKKRLIQNNSETTSILKNRRFSNEPGFDPTVFPINSQGNLNALKSFPQKLKSSLVFQNNQTTQQNTKIDDIFSNHYTIEQLYNLPPIFLAVAMKNHTALYYLLHYEADPNIQDPFNFFSPLHLALSDRFFNTECATLLIEHGAKIISTLNWLQSFSFSSTCPQLRRCATYACKQKSLLDAKVALLQSCSQFIDSTKPYRHKNFFTNKSSSIHKIASKLNYIFMRFECFFKTTVLEFLLSV